MTIDNFTIFVQNGITGGFAPPTPNAIFTLTRRSNGDTLTVTSQTRPHGTPSLLPPNTKDLNVADYVEQLTRLLQLLDGLPVQYPGAEDLYGRNTSIVVQANPGEHVPTGSYAGGGSPAPTEEQRAKFDEAVAIVEQLVSAPA